MDITLPAKRKDPTRSEAYAEQGKPVTLPETAGQPQGTLLALRVKESGESESPAVIVGYGLQHRPTRKWADFRLW